MYSTESINYLNISPKNIQTHKNGYISLFK